MAGDNEVAQKDDPQVEVEEEEDEEEIVDPHDELKESCGKHHCTNFADKLQECTDRVNSRKKTEETCVEELFDYIHCVDHCLQGDLLSKLK